MRLRWTKAGDEPQQERVDSEPLGNQPARRRGKPFRFELGWSGMFGLVVVCFCLFLWMFLLGLWAGQTILLPPRDGARVTGAVKPPQVVAGEAHTPGQTPVVNSKHVE